MVNYLQIIIINIYFLLVYSILLSTVICSAVAFREIDGKKTLKKFYPLTTSSDWKKSSFQL